LYDRMVRLFSVAGQGTTSPRSCQRQDRHPFMTVDPFRDQQHRGQSGSRQRTSGRSGPSTCRKRFPLRMTQPAGAVSRVDFEGKRRRDFHRYIDASPPALRQSAPRLTTSKPGDVSLVNRPRYSPMCEPQGAQIRHPAPKRPPFMPLQGVSIQTTGRASGDVLQPGAGA